MTDSQVWYPPPAFGPINAIVQMPGSKSLSNRALLLAALAQQPATLRGLLDSRDSQLMAQALRALGAKISDLSGASTTITPIPQTPTNKPLSINCGLAGTVMRFIPFVAALHHADVYFSGDKEAYKRPMAPVLTALRQLGVPVTCHQQEGFLPFTVHGRGVEAIRTAQIKIDASASSQFVSAPLLIGARLPRGIRIELSGPVPSLPHIQMTLAELRARGVIVNQIGTDSSPSWIVRPSPIGQGESLIEPDLSNAGPIFAAALVRGGQVTITHWPAHSTQAGKYWEQILPQMGGEVSFCNEVLTVRGTGTIRGLEIDLSAVGELAPTVAALGALANSPSKLRGIAHLRGHETDRLAALTTELNKVGVLATELPDGLEISPKKPLKSEVISTYADHRMATFGAILALSNPNIGISDIGCTAKTMPTFPKIWSHLVSSSQTSPVNIFADGSVQGASGNSADPRILSRLQPANTEKSI